MTTRYKVYRIEEDGSVTPVERCWLDGYPVGDRQLEGVWFSITPEKNTIKVEIRPEDAEHFSTLATKKWLKEIKSYALKNDVFADEPYSEGECALIDTRSPWTVQHAYFSDVPTINGEPT